eukprot:m.22439 g.22439  ORF g.22439 m.22439 type:complete len:413 (-) comp3986_c0_seq2:53-1291(-)
MTMARAVAAAVPRLLSRAIVYPPISLLIAFSLLVGHAETTLGVTPSGRVRSVLSGLAVAVYGTAGLYIVRDYLMVPLFLLPSTMIGKLPQVVDMKAAGLATVQARFPNIQPDPLKIRASDGVQLDAISLKNTNLAAEPTSKHRFIVWLNANGVLYEQNIAFAAHYATALNAHALLFNYRGVCESEGWPYESEKLAMDGRAAVGYVMTTYGTPEDHILLHGHSLGGGVVAKIAAEFPQCYKIYDRTFWSIESTAKVMVTKGLGRVMGALLFAYISSVLARAIDVAGPPLLGSSTYETMTTCNRWLIMIPLGTIFGATDAMLWLVDPVISTIGWSMVASDDWDDRSMTIYHKQDMVINYELSNIHGWLVSRGIKPKSIELTVDASKQVTHMYPLDTIDSEWQEITSVVDRWWKA